MDFDVTVIYVYIISLSAYTFVYIYLYISSNSICDTEYESVLWEWALSDKSGCFQGRIQDFKLGGVHLKFVPRGGRREHFLGISCEKSRFYAKKSYFFQF